MGSEGQRRDAEGGAQGVSQKKKNSLENKNEVNFLRKLSYCATNNFFYDPAEPTETDVTIKTLTGSPSSGGRN